MLIPIQVKPRTTTAPYSLIDQLTSPVLVDHDVRLKPVHLAIFMDLGTRTDLLHVNEQRCLVGYPPPKIPPPPPPLGTPSKPPAPTTLKSPTKKAWITTNARPVCNILCESSPSSV